MRFKKILGFASALAILSTARPAPHFTPASAQTTVEEKRQFLEIVAGLVLIIFDATAVAIFLTANIPKDIMRRKMFTVTFIDKLKAQVPDKNIVICNVDYRLSCTPETKQTVFYKSIIGKKVSYDVLVFGKGCTFDRIGDGGYQNWAYTAPTGCQINGGQIAC